MRRLFLVVPALLAAAPSPAQDEEASAAIDKVFIAHGAKQEHEWGVRLAVNFRVSGCLNEPCLLVAWFYDEKEQALPDRNGDYKDTNGNIAATNDFTPGFPNTNYAEYPIFIPYNEFHLPPGDQNLLFKIGVFRKDGGGWQRLAISDFYKLGVAWKIPETGEVTKLDVDYNAKRDDLNGIQFTLNWSTHGMKGKKGRWLVEFYYELGSFTYLHKNGKEANGQMRFVQEFTPGYEDANYTGGTYWVPYSLFPLKVGHNTFYFKVWLQALGRDDQYYTVDATRAQEFYVDNGELNLREVWVIQNLRVLVDWDLSEQEKSVLVRTLQEFNKRLYDASDGQIRVAAFTIARAGDHPDHHYEPVFRVYRDFKNGDHGTLDPNAKSFVQQVRPFAYFGTPDKPGDAHLAYEKMAKEGPDLYSRALVHEFHHACFGIGDEYGEIKGSDGKTFFGSYCAATEPLRHAWNSCIMGTYQPLHRELCKPDTHAKDASNPKLHATDCYTRVKQALKKSFNADLVVPETPVEGPHKVREAGINWE